MMVESPQGTGTREDPWRLKTPSGQSEIEAYRDDLRRVGWAVLRIDGEGEAHHIPLQDIYEPPLPPSSRL